MKYENIEEAVFLSRPNRFVATIRLKDSGKEIPCHVKNTGRCRELLIPGTRIYVQHLEHPGRKTAYDLIAVEKGEKLINMDSQAPNAVVSEWLSKGGLFREKVEVKREVRFGNSRFDLYASSDQRHAFLEVKGVTLEENGIARFPDAPTLRGVKHVEELIRAREEGYDAYLVFVIQMTGVRYLEPNDKTHPAFGEMLRYAHLRGVKVIARECEVQPDSLQIAGEVPVVL
ncbi:MAG: DNA/RNA nuclease SfsA [Fusicatenibacter sp.]|nr:DNA/RNA nuclease SfsA [Lachnospiraceae bacterium]MDY2939059.1 DNA/RNA nuclease SfsA [Fusicatenibacter sp.]